MKVTVVLTAFLLAFAISSLHTAEGTISVTITAEKVSKLKHFWKSTGLCPPQPHQDAAKYLLSPDMIQNLLLISSTPHQGIGQVRIHWLLDLVKWNKETKVYDFNDLDKLVNLFHVNNLMLGFELMGNPSGRFKNFDLKDDVNGFQDLVYQLAERYIKFYGKEFLENWIFETWNEPDHKDFDFLNITVSGFINYFAAISTALKETKANLYFGGPGGSCRKPSFSKRCWALLNFCSELGAKKCGLDFISIHKKGNADAETIIEKEIETINNIHSKYPNLKKVDIINDEADPLVGWSKPHEWRADCTYAAIIAKVITMHQHQFISNQSSDVNYRLLSNDNAFLNFHPNYFTQRTLNARFQINNTQIKFSHLVRKPALTVMGLLSKLGETQIKMILSENTSQFFGGLASVNDKIHSKSLELSSIFYYSANSDNMTKEEKIYVDYNLKSISNINLDPKIFMMTCRIDNILTNPYQKWKEMGMPDFPTDHQFQVMHKAEGPHCDEPHQVKADQRGILSNNFLMRLPGVVLQQVCFYDPGAVLIAPTDLQVFDINKHLVLIKWSDSKITSRCVKTYQIEHSINSQSSFVTINSYPVFFNSFYFSSNSTRGKYRVKMIDLFNRSSPYSLLKYFP